MTEKDLHAQFSAWLDSRDIPFLHSRTDRPTTTRCGYPDYLIAWQGRCLFIEVKVGKNTLSPSQEARIAFLRAVGNRVEVCHTLEECVAATMTLLDNKNAPQAIQGASVKPLDLNLERVPDVLSVGEFRELCARRVINPHF